MTILRLTLPNFVVYTHNVQTISLMASHVGIPLAPSEHVEPTTHLVFLGILINTTCMETSLPNDKLYELLAKLKTWSSHKKCRKSDLLSLIGKLNFACLITPAGRIFLCCLIDLSTTAPPPSPPCHHELRSP